MTISKVTGKIFKTILSICIGAVILVLFFIITANLGFYIIEIINPLHIPETLECWSVGMMVWLGLAFCFGIGRMFLNLTGWWI